MMDQELIMIIVILHKNGNYIKYINIGVYN